MTAEELARRLAALGLRLDEKALTAALAGANHMKTASARLAEWLAKDP
jgi:hypothetical protein